MDQSGTKTLLDRWRAGDRGAIDRAFARILRPIRRWAHGRLPKRARHFLETADIVQEAALGVLRRLDVLPLERPGDLEAYIRSAVRNRITDEARRLSRTPEQAVLDSDVPESQPSPFQATERSEFIERYAAALAQLDQPQREALIARFQMGYSYEAIARILGKPSAAAARMTVTRALQRIHILITNPPGRS